VPGATLRAAGVLRVTGDTALTEVELRLRLSRTRVYTRGEMAASAAGRTSSRDGDIVARRVLPGGAARGAQVAFDLSVPLDTVDSLQEYGVHVLSVEAVATTRDRSGRVAIVRSFLPWVPKASEIKPTGFAWLWPVMGAPVQLSDGTYADDGLAQEMAPDGRLGRLVAAGTRLSGSFELTWVVDPSLLEAAQDMTDGYRVQSLAVGGGDIAGAGAAVAAEWLEQLRAASAGDSVMTLPYADPDLVSLRRGNLLADVTAGRGRGDLVAAAALGRPVVSDVAWPAQGFADRATLRDLRGIGMKAAVLDARAVPAELSPPFTLAGRADVRTRNGNLAGLLYDPVLSDSLGATAAKQPLLAAQRFIAETAMITAELPGRGPERTVLVAPPRHWSPPPELLDRVIDITQDAPWVTPVSLGTLRATAPPEVDRGPVGYPRAIQDNELSGSYLNAVGDLHGRISTFGAVLSEPDQMVPALDAAVFRLESTWWRDRDQRVDRLTEVTSRVGVLGDQVQVLPGTYTFGSKSGTIPVTISNDLPQAVSVGMALTPLTARVELGDVALEPIAANSKVQVGVPAKAIANGPVTIQIRLRTPDGQPYGDPVELRVQVTQYGTVALYITIGAAAVLFAAAGLRLFRRGRGARRTSEPAPGEAA